MHDTNTKTVQKHLTVFLLLAALASSLFIGVEAASAQQVLNTGTTAFGAQTALGSGGEAGLIGIISNVINIALGFVGILVVLYMLYGGFMWMTAGGEAEKIAKAKRVIVNAVIGLVIILSSWGITVFVLNALTSGTGANGTQNGSQNGGSGMGSFEDALGGGSLESHYPGRNAVGIPRNAPIIITFKDPANPATIIQGTSDLNVSAIKIKPTNGAQLGATDVIVTKTADNRTYTIRAKNPLGSANDITTYGVELTGAISKSDGTAAFGISGYRWNFDVSTVLDVTPPRVQNVFPSDRQTNVPRNAIVTVSFDEPIDPTSGTVNGAFSVVNAATGAAVQGATKYSNGYRTVEFVPSEACGTSSCGTSVYCLPSGNGTTANIRVRIKPATIDQALGAPASSLPFDGIADAVGNSLDGNKNGTAQGPTDDLFTYEFATSDDVRTEPPQIISIAPNAGTQGVAFDTPITITFRPFMQYSTLGANNITLKSSTETTPPYWTTSQNVPAASANQQGTTVTTIGHGLFAENASYQPEVGSGVRDAYQNCFNPVAGPGCTTTATRPYCCFNPSTGTVTAQATSCTAP